LEESVVETIFGSNEAKTKRAIKLFMGDLNEKQKQGLKVYVKVEDGLSISEDYYDLNFREATIMYKLESTVDSYENGDTLRIIYALTNVSKDVKNYVSCYVLLGKYNNIPKMFFSKKETALGKILDYSDY